MFYRIKINNEYVLLVDECNSIPVKFTDDTEMVQEYLSIESLKEDLDVILNYLEGTKYELTIESVEI